ncbi:MAG: hypothetical protein IJ662_06255 [Clostridia bacterium]|nr:hypothetical protein [Clostridia bacterium]
MEKRRRPAVGLAAWRGLCAHPGEAAGLAAVQVLLRLLSFGPILGRSLIDRQGALPAWPFYAASICFHILLVIPGRFWAGERLRYFSAPNLDRPGADIPYGRWLLTGLSRYGLGCLWGLPFLLCMGYFAYGWSNVPFTTLWSPVVALGLPAAGALMLIFLLLFVYGWWRGMPVEYIPARYLGVKKTWFFCRRARRQGRNKLLQNALVNACLSLPAAVGFGAALIPYVKSSLPATANAQLIISGLLRLLRAPLPREHAARLLAVYLILYLPVCLLRKMRNAVTVRRLTRECNDLGGGHAAG